MNSDLGFICYINVVSGRQKYCNVDENLVLICRFVLTFIVKLLCFISQLFGGSKSEKDVKSILPLVTKINEYFNAFQSLSNDELRSKTQEFKSRIADHLKEIDTEIETTNKKAEDLPFDDLIGKD